MSLFNNLYSTTFDPCSGTTLLLSEYRDKQDSLNYISAGGCTCHVILVRPLM